MCSIAAIKVRTRRRASRHGASHTHIAVTHRSAPRPRRLLAKGEQAARCLPPHHREHYASGRRDAARSFRSCGWASRPARARATSSRSTAHPPVGLSAPGDEAGLGRRRPASARSTRRRRHPATRPHRVSASAGGGRDIDDLVPADGLAQQHDVADARAPLLVRQHAARRRARAPPHQRAGERRRRRHRRRRRR